MLQMNYNKEESSHKSNNSLFTPFDRPPFIQPQEPVMTPKTSQMNSQKIIISQKVIKQQETQKNSVNNQQTPIIQQQTSLIKTQFVNVRESTIRQSSNPWRNTAVQQHLQHFLEQTMRKSLFLSQNNVIPLSPEQQEIYYKIYYLKQSYQDFHPELLKVSRMYDESFLKLLDEKTLSLKEITKSQGQILKYLITSHSKVIKSKESITSILNNQKVKLLELSAHIMHRRDFESMFSFEMTFFRKKVETLEEILKDCESLLAVYSILSEEPQEINAEPPIFLTDGEQPDKLPSKAVNNDNDNKVLTLSYIDTKDIYSLALGKYDEYQGNLKKLDLAYQSYCEYYKLDKGSQEFLLKIQALLKVIFEVLSFLKLGYNDILVINRKIGDLLRRMMEEIKEELFENKGFFQNLEDSYTNVEKIIYIRLEKIAYLSSEFEGIQDEILSQITGKFILEFEILEVSEDFFKVIEEDKEKIRSFRKKLKLLKLEIKKLRDDNKSLLFLTIRLIQSKKTLKFLNLIISKVNSLLFLIGYLRNSLGKEIIYAMGLVERSKGDFNDRLEKRELQGRISLYNERMKEILSIPAFDPINRIPRKLSFLLEKAYDYLENPNNVKGFNEKGTQKASDILERLMKFSKDYVVFIDNDLTYLSKGPDWKGPDGLFPLHKRLRALDYEIKDLDSFEQWKEYLRRRDRVLSLTNDLFYKADGLKENWIDDKNFKETSRKDERLLNEIIENLRKETLEIDKIEDNKRILSYWDDVKRFNEGFQDVKKTEKKEKIIKYLKDSRSNYRNNRYIQEVLTGLLKEQIEYDRRKSQEISQNALKHRNPINPLNIYKNEDFQKKSQEFSNILSPKEHTSSLRQIQGDFASSERFNQKQGDFGSPGMGSGDKRNYNGSGDIVEEERANRPKEFHENKKNAKNNMNQGIDDFDERININYSREFTKNDSPHDKAKKSSEHYKYGKNNMEKPNNYGRDDEDNIGDIDERNKIDNRGEFVKKHGNFIDDKKNGDFNEKHENINVMNANFDEKDNDFVEKAEKFKNKLNKDNVMIKRIKTDQDDESEDVLYGWDTYYISEGLNNLFGLKEELESPLKTPKKNEEKDEVDDDLKIEPK